MSSSDLRVLCKVEKWYLPTYYTNDKTLSIEQTNEQYRYERKKIGTPAISGKNKLEADFQRKNLIQTSKRSVDFSVYAK